MAESDSQYRRTVEELRAVASLFWPSELSEQEASASIIPVLLQTQDQFISILSVLPVDLEGLFGIIESSDLPPNLFLKHLVVLTNFSGESLDRVSQQFTQLFPDGRLRYTWKGGIREYEFKAISVRGLSNQALGIDGKRLLQRAPLSPVQRDAIALLLFRATASWGNEGEQAGLQKRELGTLLGRPDELATYIKQRYIWVSPITSGAKANMLGQLAQKYVAEYLKQCLGPGGLSVRPGGRVPGVTQTTSQTGRDTAFDIVVTDGSRYAAVEVSFQVTTNSTIERKSGQARNRYEQIERAGHRIAYVLDGAGNFRRETALSVICAYSHCTVAFSRPELDVLCVFLRDYFTSETEEPTR